MKLFSKSLVAGALVGLLSSSASATSFTYEVDTTNPPADADLVEIGGTAGEAIVSFTYDEDSELLELEATFFQSDRGSIADFFFFTITDGSVPSTGITGDQTTIFVDLENEIVTGSEYAGLVDTPIAATAGGPVFSSLGGASTLAETIRAKEIVRSDLETTVRLTLASEFLPGVSFGTEVGVWLQYFGLEEDQLAYNPDGSISVLNPSINSQGGYSFIDVADQLSAPNAPSEVPEPATVALLLAGVAGMAFFRKAE